VLEARPVREDDRVVLAGDDVRVGDDQPVPGRPAGALDAEAAGGADDAHHAGGRRLHPGPAGDPLRRRGHVGAGAVDGGERVEARERVEHRPGRRQHRIEPREDLRALDVASQRPGAGRVQQDGADQPRDPQRDGGAQDRPHQPVERSQARRHDRAADEEPGALEQAGEQRPAEQRADQAHQRRVRRLGAVRQQRGRQAAAGEGARREADQGKGAGDEPLPPAERGHEHDEGGDDPVEAGHGRKRAA